MNELDAVYMFKDYIDQERNYSEYTVLNYINDINEFRRFLKENDFSEVFLSIQQLFHLLVLCPKLGIDILPFLV